jgi:hypothetical protein
VEQGGTERETGGDGLVSKGDLCHPCHTRLPPSDERFSS